MGPKAETIRVSARPAGFTLWTAAVSALAAAALIMSAVALTVAARDRAAPGVAGGGGAEGRRAACAPRAPGSRIRLFSVAGAGKKRKNTFYYNGSCSVGVAFCAQVHPGG